MTLSKKGAKYGEVKSELVHAVIINYIARRKICKKINVIVYRKKSNK